MKRVCAALASIAPLFLCTPTQAGSFDCSVVYDEFDSLMNKDFLTNPGNYVQVKQGQMTRDDYNGQQKGKLMLRPDRKGLGVAIVRTNKNSWGKFLYSWGGPGDLRGTPLLILRDVTLFGRVEDGANARVTREIRVSSSQQVDLDRGLTGEGQEADIWFHNVDGKTMQIEAVNGATLAFPMETLCAQ